MRWIIFANKPMNFSLIDTKLRELAAGNDEYAAFNRRIVNTQQQVYGVRVPDLRKLAKQLTKRGISPESEPMSAGEVRTYLQSFDQNTLVFEQVLLGGLLINCLKTDDETRAELTEIYLPLVDSWAQVDCFADRNPAYRNDFWWRFATEKLADEREFFVRYGVIMLMCNFLTPEKLAAVFAELRQISRDGYYVKMAMAWLYAEAALVDFAATMRELQTAPINPWIKKKALQKCRESRRFSAKEQAIIAQERGKR